MKKNLKIIFLAPHTAVWVHAFPEALVAEALQQGGHEIVYVTCGELFSSYCICMSALGLPPEASIKEKQNICIECNTNKKVIQKYFDFKGYDLKDQLTLEDTNLISSIVSNVTKENFLDLSIDQINIGRLALYEILLKYKKSNLNFSTDEWSSYLISLENTLASFFACRSILKKEQPDRIITYNSMYSVNQVCMELAKNQNILTYFLHAGSNLSNRLETLIVGKNPTFSFYQELKNHWLTYQKHPCPKHLLKKVTDHFLSLLNGQHFLVYSLPRKGKPIDIRDYFGIQQHQKLLVVTMSSYDEIFAAETVGAMVDEHNLVFPTQIDWIKSLINFAKIRPDLFIVVRVHPREFPNRRDSVQSAHALAVKNLLQNLPSNVRANYPTDNISLYDLAEYTDLFLNAWSSAGEEMSFLGIPVVTYAPSLVFYPPELHYVANSQAEFFSKIDEALTDGWSFKRVRDGYRWHVLKLERCGFHISESFRYQEFYSQSKREQLKSPLAIAQKIYTKVRAKLSPAYKTRLNYHQRVKECQNRAKFLKDKEQINSLVSQGQNTVLDLVQLDDECISYEQESIYIKEEIKRLLEALYRHYPPFVKSNSLRQKLLNLVKD